MQSASEPSKFQPPGIVGRVSAVRGTILDVDVAGAMPPVSTALMCQLADGETIRAVVQAHVGAGRVRAIAEDSTRRLRRGAEVRSSLAPLTVPVGPGLLGRVVDLHDNPLDGGPPIVAAARRPLRRPPPPPVCGDPVPM